VNCQLEKSGNPIVPVPILMVLQTKTIQPTSSTESCEFSSQPAKNLN
jgi:hypothetical protein